MSIREDYCAGTCYVDWIWIFWVFWGKECGVIGIKSGFFLKNGDFYMTIGVLLKDVIITENEYIIEIEQYNDRKYTTYFIGKDGKILQEVYGTKAVYTFKGDELYVRARIFATSGEFACTQPFFLKTK